MTTQPSFTEIEAAFDVVRETFTRSSTDATMAASAAVDMVVSVAVTKGCDERKTRTVLNARQRLLAAGKGKRSPHSQTAIAIAHEVLGNLEGAPTLEQVAAVARDVLGPDAGLPAPDAAVPAAPVAAEPAADVPAWLTKTYSGETLKGVDTIVESLSGGKITNFNRFLVATRTAITAAQTRQATVARLSTALELMRAGNTEEANALAAVRLEPFTASGIAGVSLSGPLMSVADVAIANVLGVEGIGLTMIQDMLRQAEGAVLDGDRTILQLQRDIRAAAPKETFTVRGERDDEVLCQIVMRRASEIFPTGGVYGDTSPLLDFDVPTLVFPEPHPDVPAIDKTYRFFAPVLSDALHCLVRNKLQLVFGDSGCGKSEFWIQVAARLGFPLFRLNMDAHLTRQDLVGQHKLVQSEDGKAMTVFVDGILPRALRQPSLLLVDEVFCGDPEIMPIMQPILEGRGLLILEDGARYVRPHPMSRIGLTDNTNGLGSTNQLYINVMQQSAATLDRIEKYHRMPYLPPDMELAVVMDRCPQADRAFVEKMVQLAGKVREGFTMGKLSQLCSTRHVLSAVERHMHYKPFYPDEMSLVQTTLEVIVLNRCDDTNRAAIKALVDAIW